MCEINPKHTRIMRLEFFTSHEMSDHDFLNLVAAHALEMEMLANKDGRIRCHIHDETPVLKLNKLDREQLEADEDDLDVDNDEGWETLELDTSKGE